MRRRITGRKRKIIMMWRFASPAAERPHGAVQRVSVDVHGHSVWQVLQQQQRKASDTASASKREIQSAWLLRLPSEECRVRSLIWSWKLLLWLPRPGSERPPTGQPPPGGAQGAEMFSYNSRLNVYYILIWEEIQLFVHDGIKKKLWTISNQLNNRLLPRLDNELH